MEIIVLKFSRNLDILYVDIIYEISNADIIKKNILKINSILEDRSNPVTTHKTKILLNFGFTGKLFGILVSFTAYSVTLQVTR